MHGIKGLVRPDWVFPAFNRKNLVTAMAACLPLVMSDVILAQDQALEEISVTGSRIRRSGLETPTPVTVVGVDELNDMSAGNLIESLSQLPQFFGNVGTNQQVGGQNGGGSNLNLRGAGVNRTLVLLNGRRVAPSNRFGTVDVSIFPEELIQTVDTVTGGASASYGTDAVAGVVNFVLDTNFTGIKTHAQGGGTTQGDGTNFEVGAAFGFDLGDRVHVIGSAEVFRQDPVNSFEALRDRGFFKQTARVTNPDPNGPTDITRAFVSPTNFSNTGIINQPGSALDKMQFLPNGQIEPLAFSGTGRLAGGCNCQAEPTQTFGVDADNEIANGSVRTTGFLYTDFDVNDNVNVYIQNLYANTQTSDRRESIALLGPWQGRIFADNAFLSPEISQIMQSENLDSFGLGVFTPNRPDTVLGDSRLIIDNAFFSTTLGLDADISQGPLSGWAVNFYGQYGRNQQDVNSPAGIRVDRLFLAMDAIDNGSGTPVCRVSVFNPGVFDDCAPINLLGGIDNISPEAAAYVVDDGKRTRQLAQQYVVDFSANGPVWEGFGAGQVSAALGASWRKEKLNQFTVDPSDEFPAQVDGTLFSDQGILPEGIRGVIPENEPGGIPGLRNVPNGFKGDANSSSVLFTSLRTIRGDFNVKEVFTEFNVPLLSGITGVQQLDFDAAGRWADYSGSGTIWAWKFGFSWQINDDLRLRLTESRDVRAATLQERFDQTRGGTAVRDPEMGGATINTASFSGGNENVAPEKSDTVTAGIIYQPSFLEGFSVSTDWYFIDLSGAIAQLSSQNVVDGCFAGDQSLCGFVIRDPGNNTITRVDNLFINLGNQRISGIDVEMNYRRDINLLGGLFNGGAESLSWRFFGTWLDDNSILNPGAAARDERAGQIAGGFSLPEFKVTTNLTYANGPVSLFLQGRFIDSGKLDRFAVEGVTIDDNSVASMFYTDLNLKYSGTARGGDWEAFFNVTNLFDRDPPPTPGTVGRTGTNEFNTSLHDTLGRRFVAGVRLNF
ncbi:MAG: TonB-dependent receptor [Pseudomonadales bacterium]|nr:TonB-dependent receptor [Pseudomonadales bacterium]